ncbi:FdhF/YdeP family oxidoreductase [Streptomyces sp. B1866]|uniref:FdhF/YdeP family oxidoreductase n=1 Tax=Streptomyces sp. B1866 TaxID=3075431 RepID=UPI00288EF4B3|nr:FdhF/YdeP family oxidoreductase [Streptomyces sp. B1866]MDT3397905.1 FdhF/YdeP family oxidoreductase [Streptomyces sp. B1866]
MAAEPPADDPVQDAPEVSPPRHAAVGLPAVGHSLRVARRQMGVRRTALTLLRVNQKDGFDCPGCAWPEPDARHRAEFCENGAKAVAEEATLRRVTPAFFAAHPVASLAGRSGYWLGQQGRLTHPMYLAPGASRYEPVSWDQAFDIVAEELRALGSPDEAVFYTSGRTSNEAAFLYQLFAREFGTNNLPDCSNLCHESSGAALTETLGVGKGSVLLDDLYQADLIIVAGQNPGTNHPRMLTALERAKANGARIITVNPLPEAGMERFKNPQTARGLAGGGVPLTDLFLQIRLGGDQALFRALGQGVLRAGAVDEEFVRAHTEGFAEYAAAARATGWEEVEAATGLPREAVERALAMVLDARRVIVCWAMGLTQHRHAVATIKEVVNFLLLRGDIGRPGAGVCPVRGHSNVQGDRTMGIVERPAAAFLDALEREFGFAPPRAPGWDVVRAIQALREGRAKVFFAMGGNFVAASPDTEVTEAAMRRARLTVHVSTKLNRSHVVTGARALILPTLGRTERDVPADPDGRGPGAPQFVTVEDSMGMVHASRGRLEPAGPLLLSEPAIVCRLARRVLGPGSRTPWEEFERDYGAVRERIAAVVPGFEDFNARVSRPGGFTLPHAPRDERRFPTATGRARFTAGPVTWPRVPPGRLLLQTLRSHDQYNTTVYGLDDRYRGIRGGRRVVLVHPDDARALGFPDGSYADLVSEWTDGTERRASGFRVVHYPTARGCAAAYFPETNVLVPLDATADVSNTPTSKSLVVRLEETPPPDRAAPPAGRRGETGVTAPGGPC